jgi:hypothetical protein
LDEKGELVHAEETKCEVLVVTTVLAHILGEEVLKIRVVLCHEIDQSSPALVLVSKVHGRKVEQVELVLADA